MFNTLPSNRAAVNETELASEVFDLQTRQSLCHDVSQHVGRRAVLKANLLVVHEPTNKVKTNVNVFCARVELVTLGELDCALVVGVDRCRAGFAAKKLVHNCAQP